MDEKLNDLIEDLNSFESYNIEERKSLSTAPTDSTRCIEDDKTQSINNVEGRNCDEFQSALDLKEQDTDKAANGIEKQFAKLQHFVRSFKNLPELTLIETCSLEMKTKLDRDIEELDFTMIETKATVENIRRIKKHRHYVKRELEKMVKNLKKLKQEELQEMELVVAVYDKELLRRWHLIKKTSSLHTMEGFVNSVIGKRQAIDNIYKMAKDRLEALKKSGATSDLPALANEIQVASNILSNCEDILAVD